MRKKCVNCDWEGKEEDALKNTIGPYMNCPICGDNLVDIDNVTPIVDEPIIETQCGEDIPEVEEEEVKPKYGKRGKRR